LSRRVGERWKPRLNGPLEYARRAHNCTGERLTRKVTVAPRDSRGHHDRTSAEFVCAAHHNEDGRHAALNVLHILSSKCSSSFVVVIARGRVPAAGAWRA
jgi:hypothetical protein